MAERELTDEEARALGLPLAEPAERELSEEEALALGLPAPVRDDWNDARGATATALGTEPPRSSAERLRAAGGVRKKGLLRSLGSSALQGFFKGGTDELAGSVDLGAVEPGNGAAWRGADGTTRMLRTEGDVYRAGRDTEREVLRGASEQYPISSTVADIGGDLASDLVLRAAGVPGVGSQPYNVAVGALSGLLRNETDLSGGESPAGAASPVDATLGGAALAYVAPKIGEKLAKPVVGGLQRLWDFAGRRVAAAGAKADELAAAKVASEVASAKGKLGSATQEGNRAIENLLRLEGAGTLTPVQIARLAQLRASGTLSALHQKLADSMLDQVPSAAGRIDTARAGYDAVASGAPQATADAAKDILSGAEAKRQVMERFRRYAPTLAGSAMGAGPGGVLGAVLGGSPGYALAGALAGSGARPALRAVERMAQHPAVQRAAYRPLQGLSGALASGVENSAGPVASAAARGADLPGEYLLSLMGDDPASTDALIELLRKRKDTP